MRTKYFSSVMVLIVLLVAANGECAEIRCAGGLQLIDSSGHLVSDGAAIPRARSQTLTIQTPQGQYLLTVYPWWGIHHDSNKAGGDQAIDYRALRFTARGEKQFAVQYRHHTLDCQVEYE